MSDPSSLEEIEQRAAERYAGTVDDLRAMGTHIAALEEALRGAVNALVEIGDHAHDDFEHMGDVQRFAHEEARKGRAALTPSDTEEEA